MSLKGTQADDAKSRWFRRRSRTNEERSVRDPRNVKPMVLWLSLLYFGVLCAIFNLSVRFLIPLLDRLGVPLFANFLIGVGGPLLLLLIASLVAYRAEGRPWSVCHLRARFRFCSMTARTWLWTLALTVVMLFGPPLLAFSSAWIRSIAPPSEAVARMFEVGQNGFMGLTMSGAYLVLAGFVVFVVVNVLGEELWWRGYVLPRQEASMGRWVCAVRKWIDPLRTAQTTLLTTPTNDPGF